MGLRLNRYRLAQKSPWYEANMLGEDYVEVYDMHPVKLVLHIKNTYQDGIYFVGFDESHVGYLLKQDGNVFLIHSSYVAPSAVEKVFATNSEVFMAYRRFYLCPISTQADLMKAWLNGTEIKAVGY